MSKKRILVVEDEVLVADDIETSLKEMGYCVTSVVASGEEALEKVEKDKPDLVMMDIELEGEMDGIETAHKILSRHGIPVVYLTAYTDDEVLQRAKITEPFGYIVKPFDDRELHVSIEIAFYKSEMERTLKDYRDHLEELVHERTQQVAETKGWFQTALDSIDAMGEGIVITDENGTITFINPKGSGMLGLDTGDILRNITGCKGKSGSKYFSALFDNILAEREGWKGEFICFRDGKRRHYQVQTRLIQQDVEGIMGTISILRDITLERARESRLIIRKSAFNFDFGGLYHTDSLRFALDFFKDLTENGMEGVIISRKRPGDFLGLPDFDYLHLWIAEAEDEDTLYPDLGDIKNVLENAVERNPVILVEGVEYLITKNGFDAVLTLFQSLNEVLYMKKQGVMVLSLDQGSFDPREYRLITQELKGLTKKEAHLDKKLMDILSFIYEMERDGIKPSQGEIQKAISAARETARQRIASLKGKGYLTVEKVGRVMRIGLTQKGRDFFEN